MGRYRTHVRHCASSQRAEKANQNRKPLGRRLVPAYQRLTPVTGHGDMETKRTVCDVYFIPRLQFSESLTIGLETVDNRYGEMSRQHTMSYAPPDRVICGPLENLRRCWGQGALHVDETKRRSYNLEIAVRQEPAGRERPCKAYRTLR